MYPTSVRGVAVELDGEVLAIGGITKDIPPVAFSDMKDEIRRYPKVIMKAAIALREVADTFQSTVYTIASSEEKNSHAFLARLGWQHVEGDIYKWRNGQP